MISPLLSGENIFTENTFLENGKFLPHYQGGVPQSGEGVGRYSQPDALSYK